MKVLEKKDYRVLIHLLDDNANQLIKQVERKLDDYFSIYEKDVRLHREMREKALPEAERMFWMDIAKKHSQIAIQVTQ